MKSSPGPRALRAALPEQQRRLGRSPAPQKLVSGRSPGRAAGVHDQLTWRGPRGGLGFSGGRPVNCNCGAAGGRDDGRETRESCRPPLGLLGSSATAERRGAERGVRAARGPGSMPGAGGGAARPSATREFLGGAGEGAERAGGAGRDPAAGNSGSAESFHLLTKPTLRAPHRPRAAGSGSLGASALGASEEGGREPGALLPPPGADP